MLFLNCLPSQVINNETPLERLFCSKPNYSLLRIFCCACWPHLRPYNSYKLSFRSKRCLFIGNSSYHKGYKCLPMLVGHVYIFHDIILMTFFFSFAEKSEHTDQPSQINNRPISLRTPIFSTDFLNQNQP